MGANIDMKGELRFADRATLDELLEEAAEDEEFEEALEGVKATGATLRFHVAVDLPHLTHVDWEDWVTDCIDAAESGFVDIAIDSDETFLRCSADGSEVEMRGRLFQIR